MKRIIILTTLILFSVQLDAEEYKKIDLDRNTDYILEIRYC